MYKKTIKYTDYAGKERTEDFYFNLNKAEVLKWITTNGDYTLDQYLLKIAKANNGQEIMEQFERLIYLSYGEQSLDGRRFIKTDEVKQNFMETEAYSELFSELVTDAEKAADFINGIIPPKLAEDVQKAMKDHPEGIPDELKDYMRPMPAGGPGA